MADNYTFNTPAGQTIARETLIAYLNVGESGTPKWAPIGKRVEDSTEEYDWGEETMQDILGESYTTMKKPTITQSFDPLPLDAGDEAVQKIWQLAVYEQNAQALANMDMLIAHFYASDTSKNFAERYEACALRVSSLGGEGGGNIEMPIEVTYGGTRTVGNVSREGAEVTFTATTSYAVSASSPVITTKRSDD